MCLDSPLWLKHLKNNGDVSCHDEKESCEIQSDKYGNWILPAGQPFCGQLERKTNWRTPLKKKKYELRILVGPRLIMIRREVEQEVNNDDDDDDDDEDDDDHFIPQVTERSILLPWQFPVKQFTKTC